MSKISTTDQEAIDLAFDPYSGPFSISSTGELIATAASSTAVIIDTAALSLAIDGMIHGADAPTLGNVPPGLPAGTGLAVDAPSSVVKTGTIAGGSGGEVVTANFDTASRNGGNAAGITVPCFLHGTHIRTRNGEVKIESLRIGDLVDTHSGSPMPIRWIGRRSYFASAVRADRRIAPIRIRAGAFADEVPERDLRVSPEHGMLIDGMLIPAAALVNGVSIFQEEWDDAISYVHLELDAHAVIYAEGAPCESLADDGSQAVFDNAAEYLKLYPRTSAAPPKYYAPRVEHGEELEGVRQRLQGRMWARRAPLRSGIRSSPTRVRSDSPMWIRSNRR